MKNIIEKCTSLAKLQKKLEKRELRKKDEKICLEIVKELSSTALDQIVVQEVSEVEGLMKRVLLYKSKELEIRAHIFENMESETLSHNHGQPFITACIEGGYIHKLDYIDLEDQTGMLNKCDREAGKFDSEYKKEQIKGKIINKFSHNFGFAQAMYIHQDTFHRVESKGVSTTTIVFRGKKTRSYCQLYSEKKDDEELRIDSPKIVEGHSKSKILSLLEKKLKFYRLKLQLEKNIVLNKNRNKKSVSLL